MECDEVTRRATNKPRNWLIATAMGSLTTSALRMGGLRPLEYSEGSNINRNNSLVLDEQR